MPGKRLGKNCRPHREEMPHIDLPSAPALLKRLAFSATSKRPHAGTRFARCRLVRTFGEQGMTNKVFAAVLAGLTLLAGAAAPAWATSRIKDLANIEGVR